jgi:hypothetical protein
MPALPAPCSAAGLQAIAEVAASIRAGYYTIGIAGGVESMTTNPMSWEGAVNPRVAESQCAQDCLLPMGEPLLLGWAPQLSRSAHLRGACGLQSAACLLARWRRASALHARSLPVHTTLACIHTQHHHPPLPCSPGITSENVAAQYGVSREEQDRFAARSHALAAAAQAAGRFRDEIVPVETVLKDPKTGECGAECWHRRCDGGRVACVRPQQQGCGKQRQVGAHSSGAILNPIYVFVPQRCIMLCLSAPLCVTGLAGCSLRGSPMQERSVAW